MMIDRRAVLAAVVALPLGARAQGRPSTARLAIATVSFRESFAATARVAPRAPLTLTRFPAFVRDTFGLDKVEYWSRHFDAQTPAYARDVRRAIGDSGSRLVNIQLDGIANRPAEIDLAADDPRERARWIDTVKRWMDLAAECGSPSLRANIERNVPGRAFMMDRVVDSFRRLAEHGRGIGVDILIENHTGHSSDPAKVAAIVAAVADLRCRSLADWGNSPAIDTRARIAALNLLLPTLALVSAKGVHFDAAYRHRDYDLAAIARATERGGYRGLYALELYAADDPPADPVLALRSMIRTISAALDG